MDRGNGKGTLKQHRIRVLFYCFGMLAFPAGAATLSSETLKHWDEYIKAVDARTRVSQGSIFLWAEESPDRLAKVRAGEILVSRAAPDIPKEIPAGLIHDWIGAVFIPHATVSQVLPVVRDYARYKDFYRPAVIDSRPVALSESEDRFSLLLVNKTFFRINALDTEYRSSQFRLDGRRCYTIAQTTRVREIVDYGSRSQHSLPENEGTGLIWRMFSVTRYAERDGGVYIELEAIALSRDISPSLHWLVEPVVRRVSRASLVKSLQQTRDAVQSNSSLANGTVAVSP
jgi:hypothetical protein